MSTREQLEKLVEDNGLRSVVAILSDICDTQVELWSQFPNDTRAIKVAERNAKAMDECDQALSQEVK